MHCDLPHLAATQFLATALASALRAVGRGPLLVALDGPLGSGKTTFVRFLARALGLPASQAVASPTFTLLCSYPLPGRYPSRLHHIDAWRLGPGASFDLLGIEELGDEDAVLCVEWASRAEEALAVDRLALSLEPLEPPLLSGAADPGEALLAWAAEGARRARLHATGPRSRALLTQLEIALAAEPWPTPTDVPA